MNSRRRSVTVTVPVFTGLGLLCGAASAAVLWWYATRPFTFYTASYEPLDFGAVRIDSVSPYGYMAALALGGALLGGVCGALVHGAGWVVARRQPRQ